MFLKTTAIIALMVISTSSFAADSKKVQKKFVASEKTCANVAKQIAKYADNEKKMKWLSKKNDACVKAGF